MSVLPLLLVKTSHTSASTLSHSSLYRLSTSLEVSSSRTTPQTRELGEDGKVQNSSRTLTLTLASYKTMYGGKRLVLREETLPSVGVSTYSANFSEASR